MNLIFKYFFFICHSERSEESPALTKGAPSMGQRFSPALAAQVQISPLAKGTPTATGFRMTNRDRFNISSSWSKLLKNSQIWKVVSKGENRC